MQIILRFSPLLFKRVFVFSLFLFVSEKVKSENEISNIADLNVSIAEIFIENLSKKNISRATGFFIAENLLVTAYHIVAKSDNSFVNVQTQSGVKDVGEILVTDPKNDLALIKTSKNNYQKVTLGSSINLNRNESVFILRSSNGYFSSVLGGDIISNIRGEFFLTTIPAGGGTSGTPIFSKDLQTVVGILLGQTPLEGLVVKRGFAFGVSVDKLKLLIRENKAVLRKALGTKINRTLYGGSLKDRYDFYRDIQTPLDKYFVGEVIAYLEGLIGKSLERENFLLSPGEIKINRYPYVYWYKRAAQEGLPEAQYALGKLYYMGRGVTQSLEKSLYWFTLAAKKGMISAQYILGWMYSLENNKNLELSFKWYKRAARQGHAESQLRLGQMYNDGQGVLKNKDKARYWLGEAALQGYFPSEGSLVETKIHIGSGGKNASSKREIKDVLRFSCFND